jgi:hypothetical protein
MRKLIAMLMLAASVLPAASEPLPARPKLIGTIVFSNHVRACWTANDCETLSPYRTWIVWKLKQKPELPYWTEDSVCVTSGFIRQNPTECSWVTPTWRDVYSYIEN